MPPGLLICSQFLLKDQEDTTAKATYSQIRSPEGLAPLLTKEDQVTNTEAFSILEQTILNTLGETPKNLVVRVVSGTSLLPAGSQITQRCWFYQTKP